MPYASRAGAEIDYELRGAGPPLVLVEGLGYGRWMWRAQALALERSFRLVVVDNRGVGRSTPLAAPYSMEEFARDVLAVLDDAGIERAAVLGASMGGMIAQSMAALAPERIAALVLACSTPGGPAARPMPAATVAEVTRAVAGESEEARLRRTMAVALTPGFVRDRAEELDAIIADRLAAPTDATQWTFQALSARSFDAVASDARLAIPALVTTGLDDRVLPWTNSLLLYRGIPHASLLLFRGQNHLHPIERAPEFNAAVLRFLEATAAGVPESTVAEVE